jgi:hypothetical protein
MWPNYYFGRNIAAYRLFGLGQYFGLSWLARIFKGWHRRRAGGGKMAPWRDIIFSAIPAYLALS